MRRVWASVISVWAMLAIVGVLAWTRPPTPRPAVQPAATTLILRGKNGATQRVLLVGNATSTAAHATTQTSPPPVG